MEKKNLIMVLGLAIAVAALVACVAIGLNFHRSSNGQRPVESAAQAQMAAMAEELKNRMAALQSQMAALQSSMASVQPLDMTAQQEALKKLQEQMDSMAKKLAEAQEEAMKNQMAAFQSSMAKAQPPGQVTTHTYQVQVQPGQTVELHPPQAEAPAADSVEGKLRAEGKTWERVPGEPVPGEYVEDTMIGRMNQPKGRGNIGKVISIAIDNGTSCATVDFGRGCVEGIMFSELAPVHFVAPEMR
jgi:Skp family chaperone for outer membrane proteins